MMNQMPPYNMFPPAFDPNQGQGMGSNCQEKIQMLESQINRIKSHLINPIPSKQKCKITKIDIMNLRVCTV